MQLSTIILLDLIPITHKKQNCPVNGHWTPTWPLAIFLLVCNIFISFGTNPNKITTKKGKEEKFIDSRNKFDKTK